MTYWRDWRGNLPLCLLYWLCFRSICLWSSERVTASSKDFGWLSLLAVIAAESIIQKSGPRSELVLLHAPNLIALICFTSGALLWPIAKFYEGTFVCGRELDRCYIWSQLSCRSFRPAWVPSPCHHFLRSMSLACLSYYQPNLKVYGETLHSLQVEFKRAGKSSESSMSILGCKQSLETEMKIRDLSLGLVRVFRFVPFTILLLTWPFAGTTGRPKGVSISHNALIVQSQAKITLVGYSRNDVSASFDQQSPEHSPQLVRENFIQMALMVAD